MKLSEEMAVRLHRMMWSDMQRELGDKPNMGDRVEFKKDWCKKNFPGERFEHNCFLCEYVRQKFDAPYESGRIGIGSKYCEQCPINWPSNKCIDVFFGAASVNYGTSPISEVLALPARNPKITNATNDETDEQKAPIFRQLAAASGLSAGNESVSAHISLIRDTAKQNGRVEKCKEIFGELSDISGVSEGDWCLPDHIHAIIQKKSSNEKELDEVRDALAGTVKVLNLYRSTLSYESNLPSSAPVAAHIKQIREYAFHDGKIHERERIMDKIGEMLNDKPAGTCKDI